MIVKLSTIWPFRNRGPALPWDTLLSDGRLWRMILLLWWIGFFYMVASQDQIESSLFSAGNATASGNWANQILVAIFAGLGGFAFFFLRRWRIVVPLTPELFGMATYLLWCLITLFWSASPDLSVRRMAALGLMVAGCYGIGTVLYGGQDGIQRLGKDVVFLGVIAGLALLISRISESPMEEILSPSWSLKGNTSVSDFGYHFGYAIAAALITDMSRRRKAFALGFFALLLVLLKGRTLMLAALTGVAFSQFLLTPIRWLRLAWGSLLTALVAVIAALASGGDLIKTSADLFADLFYDYLPYLTIGEGTDNIRDLSGREPLWDNLWKQVPDSLFGGHGYGAFWTSETLNSIYASIGWPAVNAHNGYLDELLGTGLIGLTLFAAFLIKSFVRAATCERSDRRDGVLIMTWIVLFCCFNSMDSILQNLHSHIPTYFLLIGIYALSSRSSRWREPEPVELSPSPAVSAPDLLLQARRTEVTT